MEESLFSALAQDEEFEGAISGFVLSNGKKHPAHWNNGKEQLNADNVSRILREEIDAMRIKFNGEVSSQKSVGELIEILTWDIIREDYNNIVKKAGRPRDPKDLRSQNSTLSPYNDPFHSHFCYYVLAGNSMHTPEFDQMFTDIRKAFPSLLGNLKPEDRERKNKELDEIVKVFNEHHPNSPVSIPETQVAVIPK